MARSIRIADRQLADVCETSRHKSRFVETSHLRLLLWIYLVAVLPVAALPGGSLAWEASSLLSVAIIAVCAIGLCSVVRPGAPDWLALCFFGFCYVWFGVAALAQSTSQRNPLRQTMLDDPLASGQAVVLAGILAFGLGRVIGRRRVHASAVGPTVRSANSVSWSRTRWFVALNLLFTPFFVSTQGGLGALFSSREAKQLALSSAGLYTETSKGAGALVTSAASVFPFMSLLLCFLFALSMRRQAQRRPLAFSVLFVLTVVQNVILNNPISSSRFWFLVVVLSCVFCVPGRFSAARVAAIVFSFATAATLLFPFLDAFRYEAGPSAVVSRGSPLLNKTDYDAAMQVANAVRYAELNGFSFGEQFLTAALFFIPRSIWHDKGLDSGVLLANFIRYPNENLSGPLWAEAYLDGGFVAVVGVFFLIGVVSNWAYGAYRRSSGGLDAQTVGVVRLRLANVLFPVMSLYLVLIWRGSLLQSMGRLVVLVAAFYAVFGFSKWRERREAPQV